MPTIAKGFDSARISPKSLGIFGDSIEIREDFTSSFNFHFSVFRTIADFREHFRLDTGFGTPIASSVNLNEALEVSRSLALDQNVLIYVMHVSGIRKRLTVSINEEKFKTDTQFQRARSELHEDPYGFCSKYGDAFVKRIFCGGEVALVIRFKRNILERSKRLLEQLHITAARGVGLHQAITLLRDTASLHLECDIYTQTKGFTAEQLPPSDPRNFAELSTWLSTFSEKFYSVPAASFQTIIGYEIESYGTILPLETIAIVDNTAIRAKYFFSIYRCSNAIDYYITYYQWIGDFDQAEAFQLKKQELAYIKSIFDVKQNMTDPLVLRAVESLGKMILELNAIKVPPKLVDEFTSADLGRNRAKIGRLFDDLRISPAFHIDQFPEELAVDSISIEVLREPDSKPLRGNLSLLYSFNKNVPFDEASHEIARHINIGTRNSIIVPPDLSENSRLNDVNFAYHFELHRSVFNNDHVSSCLRPCLKTAEDFRVRTYVVNKKPGPIMPLT